MANIFVTILHTIVCVCASCLRVLYSSFSYILYILCCEDVILRLLHAWTAYNLSPTANMSAYCLSPAYSIHILCIHSALYRCCIVVIKCPAYDMYKRIVKNCNSYILSVRPTTMEAAADSTCSICGIEKRLPNRWILTE